jgi:hypothetical protein
MRRCTPAATAKLRKSIRFARNDRRGERLGRHAQHMSLCREALDATDQGVRDVAFTPYSYLFCTG